MIRPREVFILSAVRTPIGRLNGALSSLSASDLGAIVIKESLIRAQVAPERVDEVIMGSVLQGGQGQGPARQAAIKAGLPVEVPAYAVNMVCASGLKSVALAVSTIALHQADVIVAGGMESMSRAPYILQKARTGYRSGHGELLDSMVLDGLWCAIGNCHMGITAENLAKKYGISRKEQDEFSALSQNKAERAIKSGRFEEEIVGVRVSQKGGESVSVYQDEHPRFTTLESLAKLSPAFQADGTVTAGNSSGINDGAAALVLASEDYVKASCLKPIARVLGYDSVGIEPSIMGLGPVKAIRNALERSAVKLDQLDLVEINEAFAVQVISVLREMSIDPCIVNVNGGAIALGHPIGASGARILVTLVHEMRRTTAKYGLAALCVGGGMGVALVVESFR